MELNEKLLNNEKDLIYYSAKEADITEEQMKIIIQDLWKGVYYYINNPDLVKNHINIEELILLKLSSKNALLKKAKKKLNKVNNIGKPTPHDLEVKEKYERIIKNIENGKKQTS